MSTTQLDNIDDELSIKIEEYIKYDVTIHYSEVDYIIKELIPIINHRSEVSFNNNVYQHFSKSIVKEYNKIFNICNTQLHINSYMYIYDIISDIIMKDSDEYIDYFYIKNNNYDLLNYALIKSYEEYFLQKINYFDFLLENIPYKYALKVALGKFYFYDVLFNLLINNLSNDDELISIINNELNYFDINELLFMFLPSCELEELQQFEKQIIPQQKKIEEILKQNTI